LYIDYFSLGASDGSLQIYEIIWPAISSSDRLIQLNLLTSFITHNKEIDDLAIDPFGTWLISVSRDHHVQIRQCSSPFDKHGELDLCQFGMNKITTPVKPSYRIRHIRFGFDPTSSDTKCFLYTSLIPQSVADKLISYIVQWYENKKHQFIVRQRRGVSYGRISATAVSNCGQYVSVGDSDGYVRIYETNRLTLLYEHRSHSIFVTDLAFVLREENYLYETSVLSISADKNLYVHNVHPPQTNLFSVSFLIIIGLLLFFLLFSQIRFTFH
jgi:WD40 repeat protein